MENMSVPIIVLTCYIIGEIFKILFSKHESVYKIIPFLMGLIGGGIGVLIFLTKREIIYDVDNVWDAVLIGMVSGLSTTGANQLIKQMTRSKEDEK